jgi:hypothetical protein
VSELFSRREFLHCVAAATTLTAAGSAGANVLSGSPVAESQPVLEEIFLSPDGDDDQSGTEGKPLRTLPAAQRAVRRIKSRAPGPISVYLRAGTYYLDDTLVFRYLRL